MIDSVYAVKGEKPLRRKIRGRVQKMKKWLNKMPLKQKLLGITAAGLAVMAVMTFVIIQIYPFPARRLPPLSWEMNCVCCLLDIAY